MIGANNKLKTETVSLAILPFDNLTGNVDQDYFARGFVEDIITDLSRFVSLEIIASYSIQALQQKKVSEYAIFQKLNVQYFLKGNLRKFGDKLRINIQLVNAHNNRILLAEKYDAPLDSVFEIHDTIINNVVQFISKQLFISMPSPGIEKQKTDVQAYDYWLRGLEYLRQGSIINDEKARDLFKQALKIDPNYGRAYAGLSLSYFNEWSCQLWEYWDRNVQLAYEYAMKSLELDQNDHVIHAVLGRIYLYRQQFDKAEKHSRNSLQLNSNDADYLALNCGTFSLLGCHDKAIELLNKARKLNPYHGKWYYTFGIFPYLLTGQFKEVINMATKVPVTISIDFPALLAVAHSYIGDTEKVAYYKQIFEKIFVDKITYGREAKSGEGLKWILLVNPLKRKEDQELLKTGLLRIGLSKADEPLELNTAKEELNTFRNEGDLWQLSFEGECIQIPSIKGFTDIAHLLSQPTQEIHCSNLMGSPVSYDSGQDVLDEKAKKEYKQRIVYLQEELYESEEMNDQSRVESINTELDQLVEHLSKSYGLAGKSRKLGSTAEKARSAVTWRIRNAIKKIESVHPQLARHLSKSIHTGTFCSYSPEKETIWRL